MSALAARLTPLLLLFLAACEDSDNPDNDNILTGFSGVVILVIVLLIGLAAWRRRRG